MFIQKGLEGFESTGEYRTPVFGEYVELNGDIYKHNDNYRWQFEYDIYRKVSMKMKVTFTCKDGSTVTFTGDMSVRTNDGKYEIAFPHEYWEKAPSFDIKDWTMTIKCE